MSKTESNTKSPAAAELLERLATVEVGELVTSLDDPTLRAQYASLLAQAVRLRDGGNRR